MMESTHATRVVPVQNLRGHANEAGMSAAYGSSVMRSRLVNQWIIGRVRMLARGRRKVRTSLSREQLREVRGETNELHSADYANYSSGHTCDIVTANETTPHHVHHVVSPLM